MSAVQEHSPSDFSTPEPDSAPRCACSSSTTTPRFAWACGSCSTTSRTSSSSTPSTRPTRRCRWPSGSPIDVAVVDYQLGSRNGLWLSRKLKRLPRPPRVVIYSAYCDGPLAATSVVAEADGLVSKGGIGAELCDTVRAVAHGQRAAADGAAGAGDRAAQTAGRRGAGDLRDAPRRDPAGRDLNDARNLLGGPRVTAVGDAAQARGAAQRLDRSAAPPPPQRSAPQLRLLSAASLIPDAMSAEPSQRPERRRYVPLLHRVAGVNALLLVVAVFVTIAVLSPNRVSSLHTDEEGIVIVVALVLVVLLNVFLVRRVVRPLEALTALARRVDLAKPGQRMPPAAPTSEAGELTLTFNEMLARLEAERREATGRVLDGQEAERLRIAQELHDQIGQELTAVLLALARVERRVPDDLAQDIREVQDAVRGSLEDLRRIAIELRPEALDDLGLESALAVLCERFSERAGLEVNQRIAPDLPELSPEARAGRLSRRPGGADERRAALGRRDRGPVAHVRRRSAAAHGRRPGARPARGPRAGNRDPGDARARDADRRDARDRRRSGRSAAAACDSTSRSSSSDDAAEDADPARRRPRRRAARPAARARLGARSRGAWPRPATAPRRCGGRSSPTSIWRSSTSRCRG